MLSRLRTYLSRMFLPDLYTPEGFRITEEKYIGPEHTVNLPGSEKRIVTVCNLFSREQKGIDEIAELLDTNRRTVISGLIHEGLILDRRGSKGNPKLERRQPVKYHLPRVLSTEYSEELHALCGQFGAETVSEFVFKEVLKRGERCQECQKLAQTN
jgi:hypothetical protein